MSMNKLAEVRAYFERIESRIGYNLVMHGAKHFGFYPSGKQDISVQEAQENMQDLLAQRLQLKSKEYVLDAGCGQGVVAVYLAQKYGCLAHGITIVPFEVQRASNLSRDTDGRTRPCFEVMDYSKTSFADQTFDALYTMEALVHSPDVAKTLAEFFRILKPGGRLALFKYTIAYDSQFLAEEMADLNWVIEKAAMHGLKSFRHDKFQEVIASAGFEKINAENISSNVIPSMLRLYKKARLAYKVIKLLGLENHVPNATSAVKIIKICEKGLIRYCVFTAQKPSQ